MKRTLPIIFLLVPALLQAQRILLADQLKKLIHLAEWGTAPTVKHVSPASRASSVHHLTKLNEVIYLLTNSRADTFSAALAQWLPTDSAVLLYNADTLLDTKQELQYDDEEGGWVSYLASFYTYDAQKNNTVQLIQQWNNDTQLWINLTRLLGAYDAQANLVALVVQNWNGVDWDSSTLFLNKYDSLNHLIRTTIANRNPGTGAWDSSQLFVFVYDAQQNLIADTSYVWAGTGFAYTNLITYQYNALIQNNVRIGQIYSNNKWKNSWSDTLSYDGSGNLISLVRWGWSQSEKKYVLSDAKIVYVYNASNQLIHRINYNGDGASAFLPSSEYLYTYNPEGTLAEFLLKTYDNAAAAFENYKKEIYYYTDVLTTSPPSFMGGTELTAFPVPFRETLHLQLSGTARVQARVLLTDLMGRTVYEQTVATDDVLNRYTLRTRHLPAGVYVLHLAVDGNWIAAPRRVVKQ